MSATLEQERAVLAHRHVSTLECDRAHYGTLALKLPALLRTAGLCQSLHFLKARTSRRAAALALLAHLAEQLRRLHPHWQVDPEALCREVRSLPLPLYLATAREAVAVANWYARLAKSELGVDLTTVNDDAG